MFKFKKHLSDEVWRGLPNLWKKKTPFFLGGGGEREMRLGEEELIKAVDCSVPHTQWRRERRPAVETGKDFLSFQLQANAETHTPNRPTIGRKFGSAKSKRERNIVGVRTVASSAMQYLSQVSSRWGL